MKESLSWSSKWIIEKFKNVEDYKNNKPYAKEEIIGNLGLQEGRQELIDIICGLGTPVKWDSGNAHIGVGNSNAAVNETQTGLLGTSVYYKGMMSGYPQRNGTTAIWKAEFLGDEANFTWEEFTVCNSNSNAGKNLNRVVSSKGTKSPGEIWTLELQITFNAS